MTRKGFTLVELLLAIAGLVIISASTISLLNRGMVASMRAKETITGNRYMQLIFSRLKNMDYFQLFAVDSRQANFGLQSSHPYKAIFQEINDIIRSSKFDYYTIEIVFMRRDSSDANGNSLTSDLISFTDTNVDLRDDYDPSIRYFDQNGDGDYYDTYVAGGRKIAEQPDTHMKQVTVKLYKQNRVIAQQTQLISLEQFSGVESPSSEATLKILVSAPTNASYLYALNSSARISAFNLVITKSYPSAIIQYRADSTVPLRIAGETDPLATVRFYVNNSGELANTAADMIGNFDSSPLAVTTNLPEGSNQLRVLATKGNYTSALAPRDIVLDLNPPQVSSQTPSGTVSTLSPYVSATLSETPINSTVAVSGIVPDVITLKINDQIVNHTYNSTSQTVIWVDSMTGLSPVVSTGSYTARVEAGDSAGYKVIDTWNFTLDINDPDNSAPSIAQKSPNGTTHSLLPEISVKVFDNQSGIVPTSIVLKVDGSVVVSSSNISSYYYPANDFVRYATTAPFVNGTSHSVDITASHWANSPSDQRTSSDTWSFTVNVP